MRRKTSGCNIPESQRHTVSLKLRLPPDVAERLRELAAARGVTLGAAVGLALDALTSSR